MQIAGRENIIEFQKKHSESKPSLDYWVRTVEGAVWKNPADVRATFRTADFAGKVVFNVGGNKYRVITMIAFDVQLVLVGAVLMHKEYDRGKWK